MSYTGDGLNEKMLLMAFVGNDYMVVWCVVLFCVCLVESEKKRAFLAGGSRPLFYFMCLYLRFLRCIMRLYFIPANTQADGIRMREAS